MTSDHAKLKEVSNPACVQDASGRDGAHLIQGVTCGVISQAKAQDHHGRLLQVARDPVQTRQRVAHAAYNGLL
jgi:hypothetical protein